ncbi:MAG TPA: isoaspartyl peptidase/L-asparaginase [Pyrinomonadaceae bacterium]|nr:isoaspartyl peptidase/L-asparaginase [Pyrinomonadaceae bacterium]
MKSLFSSLVMLAILLIPPASFGQKAGGLKQLQSPQNPAVGFIIHGGARVIPKRSMTPEKEKAYRAKLEEVVLAGYKALQDGKSSLDAVELAIRMMEDSPLFNAEGKNELDASIMDGKTLAAGAVAGLQHVKNPITLARAVMEKSPHVMMVGDGAEKFAKEQKIELVDEKGVQSPTSNVQSPGTGATLDSMDGAIGAVALDRSGNLAAGTSTGGMTNKKYGRVGDSPIIGAGTFANNNTCGVSGTGWGEYFIRLGVARDISAIMEYQAQPVQAAADRVIKQKLQNLGGDGGVIVMDKFGNMAISFNTEGMYRAYINSEGKPVVEIYK